MFQTKEGLIKPIVYTGILKDQKLLLVQYDKAPNPEKSGWWIPAPDLEFGQDPAECAENVAKELGIQIQEMKLHGVESFQSPGGWHLLYHYVIQTTSEAKKSENIISTKWVASSELEEMPDIAHGKWEINLGQKFLSKQ